VLASALTKQLDAVWAVGTNQGMRASGAAIADGTYHIFVIRRPDTGVVDIAADTSATGANIAANTNVAYTQIRRIFSILRESGAIVGIIQDGDKFTRKVTIRSSSVSNQDTNAQLIAVNIPTGVRFDANLICSMFDTTPAAQVNWLITDPSQTDTAPSATILSMYTNIPVASAKSFSFLSLRVMTNTSAQIRSRVDTQLADLYLNIFTIGWYDDRGRFG
jgi:hypothetical protein